MKQSWVVIVQSSGKSILHIDRAELAAASRFTSFTDVSKDVYDGRIFRVATAGSLEEMLISKCNFDEDILTNANITFEWLAACRVLPGTPIQ